MIGIPENIDTTGIKILDTPIVQDRIKFALNHLDCAAIIEGIKGEDEKYKIVCYAEKSYYNALLKLLYDKYINKDKYKYYVGISSMEANSIG